MGESALREIESRAAAGDLPSQLQLAGALLDAGQIEPGRHWLRMAAQSGSLDVKLGLAEHLLSFPPYDVAEAVQLIRDAAAAGSGKAVQRLAVPAADEISEPQNWSTALGHLKHAALLGYGLARRPDRCTDR